MMKLPFIQHIGVGLHITDQAIRWVEVQRIKDNLQIISVDKEYINNDIVKALQHLKNRQNPTTPFISVNIPLKDITYRLLNAPEIEEEDIFESWLGKQYEDIIPEGKDSSEYIVRHQVLQHNEDSVKCFIAAVKEEVVEEMESMLKSAGLRPICIGTGILEMSYGLILSDEFVDGKQRILTDFENESILAVYNDGMLFDLSMTGGGNLTESVISADSTLHSTLSQNSKGKKSFPAYLIKSDNSKGYDNKIEPESILEDDVQIIPAEHIISFTENEAGSDHLIALGMAVKQLYQGLDDVNFNDPSEIKNCRNEIEKIDTQHLGIGIAVLMAGVIFLAIFFNFYTDNRLSTIQAVAGNMETQITAVETALDNLDSERVQANQIQGLVQNRNYFAPIFQLIGSELPDNAWLAELSAESNRDGIATRITGYSRAELDLAKFMENLESRKEIDEVVLKRSERTPAERVYKDQYVIDSQIFSFDLHLIYSERD